MINCHLHYQRCRTGNLHLNVVAAAYTDEIQDALEPFIYELVGKCFIQPIKRMIPSTYLIPLGTIASYRGSVSAEHGIGAMKTHALHYSKNEVSVAWMKRIKELFDPNGIMNPGKVLE